MSNWPNSKLRNTCLTCNKEKRKDFVEWSIILRYPHMNANHWNDRRSREHDSRSIHDREGIVVAWRVSENARLDRPSLPTSAMSPISLGTANSFVAARLDEMLIIHDDARVISLPAERTWRPPTSSVYRFMGNGRAPALEVFSCLNASSRSRQSCIQQGSLVWLCRRGNFCKSII